MIGRGRESEVAWAKPAATGKERLAVAKIEPSRPYVASRTLRDIDDQLVSFASGVLLDQHCVGAGRHRRSGENAHRLARSDRPLESAAGGGFTDHFEPNRRRGCIGGDQRIAVHRRIGERRLGAQRANILGQGSAERVFDGDIFCGERRRDRGEDARKGLPDGNEAGSAHGSPAGARQSPDLPPLFSIRRTFSMRIERSTALAMS